MNRSTISAGHSVRRGNAEEVARRRLALLQEAEERLNLKRQLCEERMARAAAQKKEYLAKQRKAQQRELLRAKAVLNRRSQFLGEEMKKKEAMLSRVDNATRHPFGDKQFFSVRKPEIKKKPTAQRLSFAPCEFRNYMCTPSQEQSNKPKSCFASTTNRRALVLMHCRYEYPPATPLSGNVFISTPLRNHAVRRKTLVRSSDDKSSPYYDTPRRLAATSATKKQKIIAIESPESSDRKNISPSNAKEFDLSGYSAKADETFSIDRDYAILEIDEKESFDNERLKTIKKCQLSGEDAASSDGGSFDVTLQNSVSLVSDTTKVENHSDEILANRKSNCDSEAVKPRDGNSGSQEKVVIEAKASNEGFMDEGYYMHVLNSNSPYKMCDEVGLQSKDLTSSLQQGSHNLITPIAVINPTPREHELVSLMHPNLVSTPVIAATEQKTSTFQRLIASNPKIMSALHRHGRIF